MSVPDATFDFVRTRTRVFAISPNLRQGGSDTIVATFIAPIDVEVGLVQESDGRSTLECVAKCNVQATCQIDARVGITEPDYIEIGTTKFAVPQGRRVRVYFAAVVMPSIRSVAPHRLFLANGRFLDRRSFGHFAKAGSALFKVPEDPDAAIAFDEAAQHSRVDRPTLFVDPIEMTERLRSQLAVSFMKELTEATLSLAVVRLGAAFPSAILNLEVGLRLFVHLVVNYESIGLTRLARQKFPFSMSRKL
jgi:hypothetical protein